MVQSSETMTAQDSYCRDKAAPAGSSFYYATLFEPIADKPALYALFALQREITGCLLAAPDPGVNRMKLHWWSEELERLSRNQPRHPVTIALLPLVRAQSLSLPSLLNYLATIEAITSAQPPPVFNDWLDYFAGGLGRIWECSATISSPAADGDISLAGRNGGMISMFELLQDLRPLTMCGYHFLPQELLEKFNLSVHDLDDSARSENTTVLFDTLLARIENELDDCYRDIRTSSARPVPPYHLIMNRITRVLCHETRKDGARLFQHRVALTPIRKLWIAWWTKLTA